MKTMTADHARQIYNEEGKQSAYDSIMNVVKKTASLGQRQITLTKDTSVHILTPIHQDVKDMLMENGFIIRERPRVEVETGQPYSLNIQW